MKTYKNKISPAVFLNFIFLFLYCFVVTAPIQAQSPKTWEWVQHLGSRGWDITGGAAADTKNNLYIAGSFADTLCYEKKKFVSNGQTDIYITRFTQKGSFDEACIFGGTGVDHATCLTTDASDNIVFAGFITGAVSFGKIKCGTTGRSLFVASMNKKEQFSFATAITCSAKASIGHIGTAANGDIYACGQFSDSITAGGTTLVSKGKTDVFIVKLSGAGTVEKFTTLGGAGDDMPTSLAVSSSGGITIAGSFDKSFVCDKLQFSVSTKKANNFIAGTDTSLNFTWGITLSSGEFCNIATLRYSNSDTALYVSGSFSPTLTFADTTLQTSGLTDGFLSLFSISGKRLWARGIGSARYDYVNNLCVDNLGGAIVTGSIGDTVQIDSLYIEPTSNGNTAYVAQFNANGKAIWGDYISGSGRGFGETAMLDKSGNLYIYGSFSQKFEKEGESIASYGDQDVFLARYYNCPTSEAKIIGDLQFCPGNSTELKVNTGYNHILWNDSTSGRFYYASRKGLYRVSMYDKKGCLYADSVEVTQALLPLFFLGRDTAILVNNSLLLSAPTNMENYLWHDRSHGTTYLSSSDIPNREDCFLTVTDTLGCTYTDSITITFYQAGEISKYSNLKLNTWPNPVTEILNWSINPEKSCKLNVDVTNSSGKVLYNEGTIIYSIGETKQINVAKLSSGTYYIRISNTSGEIIKAQGFVKQ